MTHLRLSETDLSDAQSALTNIDINTAALTVCYDSSVFGDEGVSAAVYQAQLLVSYSADALDEVSKSQTRALQTVAQSMEHLDQTLALDADG